MLVKMAEFVLTNNYFEFGESKFLITMSPYKEYIIYIPKPNKWL